MRRAIAVCGVLAVVAGGAARLSAQWTPYPSKGVPKTADGKPDLNAPPPKTADGKPSFAGVWHGAPVPGGRGRSAAPAPPSSGPPLAVFRDVGANIPGGLPLTAWGKEELARRVARNSQDNPEAHCLPMGLMQFHTQGFPRKFIQTPEEIVILYEASSGIRQIFTDGRSLPTDDPQPWYYGYSVGHWEGDALVVETSGFRDDGWLDIVGNPLTEEGKITERFRRPTFGRMEIDITVDDRKAYTRPWTVRHVQEIMLDTELIEFICEENNRFK
jgi:hypothetical protein